MATFTTGDTAPALTGTCLSGAAAADITGAAVVLHLRKPGGTVLTKTATIVLGTAGTWSYTWEAGVLDEAGRWSVEAQVTYSGGLIETFGPADFAVQTQIA